MQTNLHLVVCFRDFEVLSLLRVFQKAHLFPPYGMGFGFEFQLLRR